MLAKGLPRGEQMAVRVLRLDSGPIPKVQTAQSPSQAWKVTAESTHWATGREHEPADVGKEKALFLYSS